MIRKTNFRDIIIYDNYISNVREILDLIDFKYQIHFQDRRLKELTTSEEDKNGGDLLEVKRWSDLYHTIFKTIPKDITPYYPDKVLIYKYKYGNYLPRHVDPPIVKTMESDLIFLQSEFNHLKIYTDLHPEGYFVEEIPGRRIILPTNCEHEVTSINQNEIIRYTLVMTWFNKNSIENNWHHKR